MTSVEAITKNGISIKKCYAVFAFLEGVRALYMRIITYLFLLLIIVLGVSFAILNSSDVTINYYVGLSTLPLSLLVAIVFALGGLLGVLIGFWLLLKVKVKNYRLAQRLKLADAEIENLRAIPLRDQH